MWLGACVKTWSKTQDRIALSSGEAELGAMVKASTESIGFRSMLEDFGIDAAIAVHGDAAAAIGITRDGGGDAQVGE